MNEIKRLFIFAIIVVFVLFIFDFISCAFSGDIADYIANYIAVWYISEGLFRWLLKGDD